MSDDGPFTDEELATERILLGASRPRYFATIDSLRDSLAEAERKLRFAVALAYDTGYDAGRTSVEQWASEQCDRADAAESRLAATERVVEAARAWHNSVLPADDPLYGDLNLYDELLAALAALSDNRPEPEAERAPQHPFGPWVKGKCPACGTSSLFVATHGYLTCGYLPCPDPTSPSEAIGVEFTARPTTGEPEG